MSLAPADESFIVDQKYEQTCFRCSAPAGAADYFVDGPHDLGVCGECVSYLMSVMAIDDVAMFERHADSARLYVRNNESVREGKALESGRFRRMIDGREGDLPGVFSVTPKKVN